ncbi:MAG: IgGFc-binding protein [Myxococcota bacterium]
MKATFLSLGVLAGACLSGACLPSNSGNDVGSETHFLRGCTADAECGPVLSCLCGLCTRACDDDPCGELSVCMHRGATAAELQCDGAAIPDSMCLVGCGDGVGCGTDEACVDGACVNGSRVFDEDGCVEGAVKACLVEGRPEALICNASGTAFAFGTCRGPDFAPSPCRNERCSACFAGDHKCDGNQVMRCLDDESGWAPDPDADLGALGCEFVAVDLDNAFVPGGEGFFDAAGADWGLLIANPRGAHRDAFVTIQRRDADGVAEVTEDAHGAPVDLGPIAPGERRVVPMPRADVDGTTVGPLAFRITASTPIALEQMNPLAATGMFSTDGSLLYPTSQLGREYYAMTREQTFAELRGFVTVVAIGPGTTHVEVRVSTPTQAGTAYPGREDEVALPALAAGETRAFDLDALDVLNLETNGQGSTDLTGTHIVADQPVAVFGGSEAANAPNTARCVDIDPLSQKGVCAFDHATVCGRTLDCVNAGFNTCCADHLEEQLPPLEAWGADYVVAKTSPRGLEKDVFRILTARDDTHVSVIPPPPGVVGLVLNAGEHVEIESATGLEIHADNDKPILVGQFMAAADAPTPNVGGIAEVGDAGVGDPAFLIATPEARHRKDFVVVTPDGFDQDFVQGIAPIGATIVLDGTVITTGLLPGSGTFGVFRARVAAGLHQVRMDQPGQVILYGFSQFVSYAMSGGMSLR